MKKFFFASLFMFLCLISVESTSLKAQFEEDLPQITTNDTLNYPIKTVWKSIKRAFFVKGTFSDPSTREPKLDENIEKYYTITLIDDAKGSSSIIEDTIYHAVLEDMELFGESLVHYLNTI